MGKTCQICGKQSGMYPLCKNCIKQKENGEIVKCKKCGEWHNKNENCICEIALLVETKKTKEKDNRQKEDLLDELTCIICDSPSNGKHFCYNCWNKYKDKSIDIRITHCNSTQLLDEYGNKTIRAKDGRLVRSLSEKIILDYFFDNYIRVIYEKTIPYTNEKGEDKELHPDFYLNDYDLYIEFNGLTKKSYLKMKNYASKIYKEKGLKVEILESKDISDIENTMQKLFNKYPKK